MTVRTLFDAPTIAARIEAMAAEIKTAGLHDPIAVVVLKGGFVFAADLLRALHRAGLAPHVEFITLSSYREATVSSGHVALRRDVEADPAGRDVLLIDDILESGRTLAFARRLLLDRGARRVMTAVLLEKPGKRAVDATAEFVGFECPDLFVVGYGMDWAHALRELPFVGIVVDSPP